MTWQNYFSKIKLKTRLKFQKDKTK